MVKPGNPFLVITSSPVSVVFFFNDTATTEIYTLSLHDALPICTHTWSIWSRRPDCRTWWTIKARNYAEARDRKSTRLNSSHSQISYAVFCLKKKIKFTSLRAIQRLVAVVRQHQRDPTQHARHSC